MNETQLVIGFLAQLFLNIAGIIVIILRVKAKKAENQVDSEKVDLDDSKVKVDKERIEADSLRFVLRLAQNALESSQRLSDLEKASVEWKHSEEEYKKQVNSLNESLEAAHSEIIALKARADQSALTMQGLQRDLDACIKEKGK